MGLYPPCQPCYTLKASKARLLDSKTVKARNKSMSGVRHGEKKKKKFQLPRGLTKRKSEK